MHPPRPSVVCPDCRADYEVEQNFCGRCGADMRGVEAARADGEEPAPPGDEGESRRSRRARRRRAGDDERWLGKVIDDRYRVIETIGRGGMGVVYRVEHLRMGKIAAMKVLHHDLESDPEVSQRFRNEAAAISRLTHPNTVQVFDFGAARGALYLIMEFVRGLDIGTILERDGPMPLRRAAPLVAQIAAALGEAHDRGVVHRDLKPENVLVTRTHGGQDFVKVLDFGLAKLGEREDPATSSDDNAIVGTPYFMSPEQIRGDDIDARADLYSLGALMYTLLTGEPPFVAGNPVGVLTKHLTEPLEPPSARLRRKRSGAGRKKRPELDIPPEIDELIARAMAKEPEDRHASASALSAELAAVYRALPGEPSAVLGAIDALADSADSAELAANIDYGIDSALRLRRADLDDYESSMRRRRWGRMLVVPLVLAALAGGAFYYLRVLENRPLEAEREPNDDLADANPIAAGAEITGLLGKRVSVIEGDRDFYRVAGGGTSAAVSVQVTAIPNIDIALRLYAPGGQLIDAVDENGVGQPEAIHDRAVDGDVVVLVGHHERDPSDVSLPTENVSDIYRLTVERRPLEAPGREREPNDNPGAALPIAAGRPISGTLDRRADVDCYRFEGAAGRYQMTIQGAEGAPLRWTAGEQSGSERRAVIALSPGSIVKLQRGDADAPRDRPLPGASAPYRIELLAE